MNSLKLKDNASTTLSGAITSGATSIGVTDGSVYPAAGPFVVRVDDEYLLVTARSSNTLTATRGHGGTTAASHSAAAAITLVVPAAELLSLHWADVRSYGALGDGSTDDTDAFHDARDAAGVGGTIRVPAGTFITGKLFLNVADQTWLLDPGATVKLKNGHNGDHVEVSASGITLEGGTWDGNAAGQTTGTAFVVTSGGHHTTFRKTNMLNSHDSGCAINDASWVEFDRVHMEDWGAFAGVSFSGNSQYGYVHDCFIQSSGGAGTCVMGHSNNIGSAVSYMRVIDNHLRVGSTGSAFAVEIGGFGGDSPIGCKVSGNMMEALVDDTEGGISFSECQMSMMNDNIYDGGDFIINNSAYELAFADDSTCVGNHARGGAQARLVISVDQSSRCTVTGNYIYGWKSTSDGCGIGLGSSQADRDVCDNVVLGNVIVAQSGNTNNAIWVQANGTNVNVDRNILSHNVCVGSGSGTAIRLSEDIGTIDKTIIVGNSFTGWTTKVSIGDATNTVEANGN